MDPFWTGPLGSILKYFVTKKDNWKKENEMIFYKGRYYKRDKRDNDYHILDC